MDLVLLKRAVNKLGAGMTGESEGETPGRPGCSMCLPLFV